MRFPSLRRHSRFARDLDAYVDGELVHARVRELEEHLARCTVCARIVEESQLLKRMAAALPELAAPRSFRLTAAMVAEQPSRALQPDAPRRLQMPLNLARGAAAIAIFGLIATVTVDLARGGSSSNTSTGASKAADFGSVSDAAGNKFASGTAASATPPVPSAQSAPSVPSVALATSASSGTGAPPRAGVLPSPTGAEIGPPTSRGTSATASAGGQLASSESSAGSSRSTYHLFEAGFAAAVVLFAGAAIYLTRRARTR